MLKLAERFFLKTLIIAFIFVGSYTNVNACWCRNDPEDTNSDENFKKTISRLVNSSDFVFSGTLVDENNEQLIFKIDNVWKGDLKNKVTFYFLHNVTDDNEEREYFIDSCNYTFELNKNYLVYANVTINGLSVSKCGRTNFLNNAQRDIEELNRRNQILEKIDSALLQNYSKVEKPEIISY